MSYVNTSRLPTTSRTQSQDELLTMESSLRQLQSPAPDLEIAHWKRSDCLLHLSGWGVSKISYNHPGKGKFKDVLKNYKQRNLNEIELIFSACSSHQTPNHLKTLKVGARPWTKTFRPFRKNLGILNPSANGFCSVVPSVIMNIFLIISYCLFSGYLGSFPFWQ